MEPGSYISVWIIIEGNSLKEWGLRKPGALQVSLRAFASHSYWLVSSPVTQHLAYKGMRQLIVSVSMTVLWAAQGAGKMFLLSGSGNVFLEEMPIWRLSQQGQSLFVFALSVHCTKCALYRVVIYSPRTRLRATGFFQDSLISMSLFLWVFKLKGKKNMQICICTY